MKTTGTRAWRRVLAALSALLLIGATACSTDNGPAGKSADGLQVVASFTLLSDMVEKIAGGIPDAPIHVHNLVPTGTDPHEYEPLPQDLQATTDADLVVYNGLDLEGGDHGWLHKLTDSVGVSEDKMVEAAADVPPKYLTDEAGKREINPHAFVDPTVGVAMAKTLTNALADAMPKHADQIHKQGADYAATLEQIDHEYRTKLGALPKDKRVLVTSEHAYQYLADTYDLEQLYIWQIDTDENGSPEQIRALVDQLKHKKPTNLFVESNVDRRPMETVSKESGIPIWPETLHSDELGKPGSTSGTYEDFLRSNLKTLIAGMS